MTSLKGSIWRRWDLHIHTPHSCLSNGFGDDFDEYAKKLFKDAIAHDIHVIGVTDYFGIWGYKELKSIQSNRLGELLEADEIERAENILLLPNIELRLDVLVDGNRVNFHVIFSDEIDCDTIDENFLSELKILYEGNPQGLDETRKLSIRTLEQLGSDLKAEHGFEGTDVFVGMSNAFVSYKEISEILARQPALFKGRYFLGVVADEDLSQVSWNGQGHLTRKILVQKSDFLFASNPKTIQWGLGELGYDTAEEFCKEFKTLKPCIHGSDAHNYDELFYPSLNRFCWVKADPTFEGLKQILYEPSHRVFIGEYPPPSPVHKIEHVSIDFPTDVSLVAGADKFCFLGKHEIYFSSNFTCVVGGRGTGKSTLLNLIHNRLSSGDNNFFKENKLKTDDNILKPFDCVTVDDDEEKYVEFLGQNEIEAFAVNQERFSKAIFDRIERLDAVHKLGEVRGALVLDKLDLNKQVKRLEKIRDIAGKLSELKREKTSNEKLTTSFEDLGYVEKREDLNKTVNQTQVIETSKELLFGMIEEVQRVLSETIEIKEPNNAFETAYLSVVQGLKKLVSDASAIEQYKTVEAELIEFNRTADGLREGVEEFLNSRGLSVENIVDVSKATERIAKLESEVATKEAELALLEVEAETYSPNVKTRSRFETILKELMEPVVLKLQEVNSQQVRSIGIEYHFNTDRAQQDLLESIYKLVPTDPDGRRYNREAFGEILFCQNPCEVNDKDSFIEAMESVGKAAKTTQGLCDFFSDDTNFEIYKLYVQNYFSDADGYKSIKVTYDGKPLAHTSFGQRCTAAIVVLLLIGNTPIMIDEPEAHLDSALISKYLIDLIKSKKTERQVIFATHNANFVVNGDAELIHILSVDDNGITQIDSATIENLQYREQLLALEGGIEAFQLRGKKYSTVDI